MPIPGWPSDESPTPRPWQKAKLPHGDQPAGRYPYLDSRARVSQDRHRLVRRLTLVRFVRSWERRCPILGADLEATPSVPGRNCLTLRGASGKGLWHGVRMFI
jgi:hypothetical protein